MTFLKFPLLFCGLLTVCFSAQSYAEEKNYSCPSEFEFRTEDGKMWEAPLKDGWMSTDGRDVITVKSEGKDAPEYLRINASVMSSDKTPTILNCKYFFNTVYGVNLFLTVPAPFKTCKVIEPTNRDEAEASPIVPSFLCTDQQ